MVGWGEGGGLGSFSGMQACTDNNKDSCSLMSKSDDKSLHVHCWNSKISTCTVISKLASCLYAKHSVHGTVLKIHYQLVL